MGIEHINGRDYETISFSKKLTNTSVKIGVAISLARGFLALGDRYRIYNTISGEPILRGLFVDQDTALKMAEWIEKELWDYFDIWLTYPQADIISWCKYTTKNGIILYEIIEDLKPLETITMNDVAIAYRRAKEMEKRWKIKNI